MHWSAGCLNQHVCVYSRKYMRHWNYISETNHWWLVKFGCIIKRNTVSLLKRIFKVQSPLKRLTIHMLSQFISKGTIVPGTIVSNILSMGLSPVQCAFNDFKFHLPNSIHDNGHIDSIRDMVFHANFITPYSEEHTLVYLLTKSF